MWWLVLLVLLLALLLTAVNFRPGPAWAEMPTNRALLTADRGLLRVADDDGTIRLAEGERRYVDEGARIEVAEGSTGSLTFQGGSVALLCAGSETRVGRLWTGSGRARVPNAALTVEEGRLLADTTSPSGAFKPLTLVVSRPLGDVTSTGEAWYAADPAAVTVAKGQVSVAGTPAVATNSDLSCGDGVAVEPPAAGPSEAPPSEVPSELPVEVTPSTVPTTSAPPTSAAPTVPGTTPPPADDPDPTTTRPTTRPPTTRPPTTTTRPPTTPPRTTPPPTTPSTTPPTSPPTSPTGSQTSPSTNPPPIG
jgi:putative peptide zinc metalloprotease protein